MSTPQVSETKTVTFDFETLSARDRYKLLIGTIVPRPIALVTTIDQQGRVNAAPFSFFNCLSADPPILALGIENHPDMSFKETALNIRLNEEFTVNIVSPAIAEAMHVCAVPFSPERDELLESGLTAMPGKPVASPWIKEAPAAFECRRHLTLEVGKSRQIILGEIIFAHYREDVVDMNRLHVETAAARTLRRDTASNGLIAVRRAARQSKSVRFTALLHHITIDLLKRSYLSLERDSAPGIDGVTWQTYGENLEEKLEDLHDKVHRGSYRARPARRTYIPKADGSKRPLSILCPEDKIVQQAVATVLEAIYEEDFLGFSYGFRPGRG